MASSDDQTAERSLDEMRGVLADEPDIAYALLFGSAGRGALRPDSDVDVAVELRRGAPRDSGALGRLAVRFESAAGRHVDLVLLEEAAAPLAYRIFRDGRLLIETARRGWRARRARSSSTSTSSPSRSDAPRGSSGRPPVVVDRSRLAKQLATVHDGRSCSAACGTPRAARTFKAMGPLLAASVVLFVW